MTKRLFLVPLFLVICSFATLPVFDPAQYLAHIKYLASDDLQGRGTGSPELEKAAEYLAKQYKSFGLTPVADNLKGRRVSRQTAEEPPVQPCPAGRTCAGPQKSYLQAFPVTTSARMGKKNVFEVSSAGEKRSLVVDSDFVPLNFSSKGKADATVVFAGYGITAPEYNYDDYAGLDAKGKFVLVFRHEPQEFDEKSVFEGKAYTDHAQLYSKAANAKRHGAVGMILVNDRFNHPKDSDELEAFGRTAGPADSGILVIQTKASIVEPWFQTDKLDAAQQNLSEIARAIDKDLKPRSFAIPHVEVRENTDVEREVKIVHNVAAYLPGETPEYVIIGAHYDHLGLGDQNSLAPSLVGSVHHGADDNASGTAGVLELARYFTSQPKLKRGILFLSFAGEELGLLGSSYYAAHPELPIEKAVAMINLDMIGRVRDGKIYVGGAGTGTTLRKSLDSIAGHYPLKIDYSDSSGYGSSDHTSFTTHQVPVLFFFSGLHADYHKPSDTWDKIDAPAAVQVLKLVAEIATRLDSDETRPQFVQVMPDPHSGAVAGVASSKGGYGPDFGSIPDFAEPPKGVRFSDVRPGSPAAKAGLKAGDILMKFGDRDIQNLYDFTYALRAHKPGDMVEVEFVRDNRTLKVTVLLTERK